jgi:hypothetical protein
MKVFLSFAVGGLCGLLLAVSLENLPVSASPKGVQVADCEPSLLNGDSDGSGMRDVNDAIMILRWLFLGSEEPVAIVCVPPPEPIPAKFRFRMDVDCNGEPMPATVDLCGVRVQDDITDRETTTREIPGGADCALSVTAFHVDCGPIAVCGTIPAREAHVYDLILTADGVPTVRWYEQALDEDGNPPAFPSPGQGSDGQFFGEFGLLCSQ